MDGEACYIDTESGFSEVKILIVDDDNNKARDVSKVLLAAGVPNADAIQHVTNAHDAAKLMRAVQFDLLVLDLVIPKTKVDEAELEGGQLFLRHILNNDAILRPSHIVGLTSFDEARESSEKDFNNGLWSIMKFDPASTAWMDQLTAKVRYISSTNEAAKIGRDYEFDIAFVCALNTPELKEVLRLPCGWEIHPVNSDPTQYWIGSIVRSGRTVRLIACHAAQMGMAATAAIVSKVSWNFRPRLIVMSGICAGREGDVQLGDVVVANPSWDYGSGKFHEKGEEVMFAPDPIQVALDPMLRKHAEALADETAWLDKVRREFSGSSAKSALNLVVGPMATGAAVRADDGFFDDLAKAKRKVIAVDMEAYAVFAAAAEMPSPRSLALVVKSVCDFANSKKDDSVQQYAAYVSSMCALEISLRFIEDRA